MINIKNIYVKVRNKVIQTVPWNTLINEVYSRPQAEATNRPTNNGNKYKRQVEMIQEKTLDDWKASVMQATDPDNPRRGLLYRFYQALYRDEHLQTTMDNRILPVQQAPFKLTDKNKVEDTEAHKLLERPWFQDLIRIFFLHRMQGVSLADMSHLDANMELTNVEEIPMSNYIPQEGIIIKEESDMNGWSYIDGALEPYYVQFGRPWDLGMLNELAIIILAKKLGLGSWMNYIEKYGIPPAFVVTDRLDTKRTDELYEMMLDFRNNFFAILQGNEHIDFGKEAGGNTTNAFEPLEKRADGQISKRLLGQTGTTENNPYDGTAKVHEKVEKTRHESDKILFSYYFNYIIKPKLLKISPVYAPLENLTFEWDETESMTMSEYIKAIVDLSGTFSFDAKEVSQRTGLPITGQIDTNQATNQTSSQKKKIEAKLGITYPSMVTETQYDFSGIVGRVMKKVYDKKVKTGDIDKELFNKTYEQLNEHFKDGWGKDYYDIDNANETTKARENLYKFSGAKTFQQIKDINEAMYDENGKKISFDKFSQKVLKISDEYNINYLKTEFDTADTSARRAKEWKGFKQNADILPNLRYITAGDNHVRESHRMLDGIVKPITDPFWKTNYPPNGWNCRCYVEQTDESASPQTPIIDTPEMFQNNVGETGEVFTVLHPYFSIPDGYYAAVRKSTELNKLFSSYYKDEKSSVLISEFADSKDLAKNIKNARIFSDQLNMKVKIRPHINEDGIKNPEYLINEQLGDLKNITSTGGFKHGLSAASKQKCKYTVFNLEGLKTIDAQSIHNRFMGILGKDFKYDNIEMILVNGKKSVKITWNDVKSGKDIDYIKILEE